MNCPSSGTAPAKTPAYRVEAPRASDAIGLALRGAYMDEYRLPDDMAALLALLNKVKRVPRH